MDRVTRTILSVTLTLLFLIGCSTSHEPPGEESPTVPADGDSPAVPVEGILSGNLAPSFQLQSLDGETIALGDLRGKPVLINFWATWCSPCRGEMPYIQEIYEEWTGKGLVLLTINIGEGSSEVEEFIQSNNLSFAVLLDTEQDVARKYKIQYIPTTFFIDKDGIIQGKMTGAFKSKSQIEDMVSKIMP